MSKIACTGDRSRIQPPAGLQGLSVPYRFWDPEQLVQMPMGLTVVAEPAASYRKQIAMSYRPSEYTAVWDHEVFDVGTDWRRSHAAMLQGLHCKASCMSRSANEDFLGGGTLPRLLITGRVHPAGLGVARPRELQRQ